MFQKIMVPVDLAHLDSLSKALACAADLARHYGAEIVYAGVINALPGALSHTPAEYEARLTAFAKAQADALKINAGAHAIVSHDPTSDLDRALLAAVTDTGADLVVVASHKPGILEYLWSSHGGHLAEHAACSVMVVRG